MTRFQGQGGGSPQGKPMTPRQRLEAQQAQMNASTGKQGWQSLPVGIAFGIGAAIFCAVLWWLVGKFTEREFIYGAVIVGGLVGVATVAGAGQKSINAGLVAGLLGVASVIGGKMLYVQMEAGNMVESVMDEMMEDSNFALEEVAYDRALDEAYEEFDADAASVPDVDTRAEELVAKHRREARALSKDELKNQAKRSMLEGVLMGEAAEERGMDPYSLDQATRGEFLSDARDEVAGMNDVAVADAMNQQYAQLFDATMSSADVVQDSFGMLDWIFIAAAGVVGFLAAAKESE